MSGIAILFVLAIHGCASSLSRFYPESMTYTDTTLCLRVLSNFVAPAVPMFLFVSGFKYAANDTQTPYRIFLKKRLPRVLMSFAILNTLFWLLDSIMYMDAFDLVLLAKTYADSWLGNSVAYQLWYIPMYCFVIVLCPLVRRWLPWTRWRFMLYAVIGIIQRFLELYFPVLGTYPIRFVSYPVFFEMGVLAQEQNWRGKSKFHSLASGGAYILGLLAVSYMFPALSAHAMTKYIGYYFVGTSVMFWVSCALKDSRTLQWMGKVSYPVFLLHEPLIGNLTGRWLSRLSDITEFGHAVFWVVLVLVFTALAAKLIRWLRFDRILWDFRL